MAVFARGPSSFIHGGGGRGRGVGLPLCAHVGLTDYARWAGGGGGGERVRERRGWPDGRRPQEEGRREERTARNSSKRGFAHREVPRRRPLTLRLEKRTAHFMYLTNEMASVDLTYLFVTYSAIRVNSYRIVHFRFSSS